MRASSDPLILALEAAVRSPRVADYLEEALTRTVDALHNSDGLMAWEVVPLGVFAGLPPEILSCWVFLLRASANTGAERHPNSHQRSLSLLGEGDVQLRSDGDWQTQTLTSDPTAAVDSQWATIPANTWHRWLVGPGDWGVLSFHTVPADQLIEERPSTPDDTDAVSIERRRYHDQA